MTVSPVRIGVIGTGAIGGFYGLMLARAGFDVHFLLRSEYAAVAEHGLRLNSQVHGALGLAPVQAYHDVAEMPPCDWLLVGAKTTSNAELAPLIARAAAPGAKVLLLQNGLAVEEGLRPLLPDSLHLLGGLCYICVHRSSPGVIEHQALGAVHLGYHSGPAAAAAGQAIAEEGAALFRQAGLDSVAMPALEHARWQKLVWNVPYNGLSVLLDSGTRALMANADSRALIADAAPSARYVRAFNSLGWENFADPLPGANLFFAADPEARAVAEELITAVGLEPAFLGDADATPAVDGLLPLWFALVKQNGGNRKVALRVVL